MKKTLLAILATVAMVACSNDEIVREAAPEAIGFDNAFINIDFIDSARQWLRRLHLGKYTLNQLKLIHD